MKRLLMTAALCLALAPAARAGGDTFSITADQWAQPRSGAALLKLAPLHDAVADWLADPTARIVIQHAGTDTGHLWAGELSDWLVALGVPADRIDKRVSADQPDDSIALVVEH